MRPQCPREPRLLGSRRCLGRSRPTWSRLAIVAALLVFLPLFSSAEASATIVNHGASTPWPGGRWQPDPPTFGMTVVSGVPITMDDGVVLFANVEPEQIRPPVLRVPGTFPVLLTQNPYVQAVGGSEQPYLFYVSRGGTLPGLVYVRGTLQSMRARQSAPLPNPALQPAYAEDGVELVTGRPTHLEGSNGVVGLVGCSFLGIEPALHRCGARPDSPVQGDGPRLAHRTGTTSYFAGGIPGPSIGLLRPGRGHPGTQHLAENTAYGPAPRGPRSSPVDRRAYNNDYWQVRTTSPDHRRPNRAHHIPLVPAVDRLERTSTAPECSEFYAALQNAFADPPPAAPMSNVRKPADRPLPGHRRPVDPWPRASTRASSWSGSTPG